MDMEIRSSKEIVLNFYNIQPIKLSEISLKNFFTSKVDLAKLDFFCKKDKPKWLEKFQEISSVYNEIRVIEIEKADINLLKNDLKNSSYVNNQYSLYEHVIYDEITYYLLYDFKTMFWILMYEIPIKLTINELNSYLFVESYSEKNDKYDLYNIFRNILVRSNENSKVSNWTIEIEKIVFIKIYDMLTRLYKIRILMEQISISYNSGNITNVICCGHLTHEEFNNCKDLFIILNDFAERIDYNTEPMYLGDRTVYYFNGRFHTILIKNIFDKFRYIPIQFHLQYMWTYLSFLYQLMETLNTEILSSNSKKILSEQNDLINSIINKTQTTCIFNENFKRSIEADNENIYSKIEKYWNIERFLEGTERYVDNFRDYLNRLYLKINSRSDSKQNSILLGISILQLIALISVWNDYISLINEGNIKHSIMLLKIFGDIKTLLIFNFYLPIIFFVVFVILIIYIYISKKIR